jgi:serine/threonine-protein kinase HipA
MKEIPVIKIYIWNHFVGALSWDDERGYAMFQYDEQFPKLGLDLSPLSKHAIMMTIPRTSHSL